jgi:hypothetical protein
MLAQQPARDSVDIEHPDPQPLCCVERRRMPRAALSTWAKDRQLAGVIS